MSQSLASGIAFLVNLWLTVGGNNYNFKNPFKCFFVTEYEWTTKLPKDNFYSKMSYSVIKLDNCHIWPLNSILHAQIQILNPFKNDFLQFSVTD